MEIKTLKCGFIGAGFASRFHYRALQHVFSAKVEVKGVYTVDDSAKVFAQEIGASVYESLDKLIEDCDIIHVCTPPVTHEPMVVAVLEKGKNVIVEKPFTGYFGDGSESFDGNTFDREAGYKAALESCQRMLDAEKKSAGRILYAENWIYAPAVQKEKDIIEKTGAQVLWITGEQSHSGSHAPSYGNWRLAGGGTLIGKGCHPLSAALYFKQVEGLARNGKSIRPVSVSSRAHAITKLPCFEDKGYIRTDYKDSEDFAEVHVTFEDGTVADLFANELSLGGTNNQLRVVANNHHTKCNMSHNNSMQSFTPEDAFFEDVYVVEKTETKAGWSEISPDEGWFLGYQHELDAFYKAVATGGAIESNSKLASDTIATIYAAYLSASKGGVETEIKNL